MNKVKITWNDVRVRLKEFDTPFNLVYGVPRGGLMVCAFFDNATVVVNPEKANIIIDDIIDSGKTRKEYLKKYPDKEFIALFDKQKEKELTGKWLVMPWEKESTIETNILRIIQYIGDDPNREGLLKTPERVIKSYEQLFKGYSMNSKDILKTFSADGYDQIILLKDIEMYSTCEHHLLPFFGKAHVAYLPDKKIVGISKLARLVEMFSRRLQIQERIGDQVVNALMTDLGGKGAACIIEAKHFCMLCRGVEKQNSVMVTSSMKGVFMANTGARQELLQLLKQ